jgi:hypothetical protein
MRTSVCHRRTSEGTLQVPVKGFLLIAVITLKLRAERLVSPSARKSRLGQCIGEEAAAESRSNRSRVARTSTSGVRR